MHLCTCVRKKNIKKKQNLGYTEALISKVIHVFFDSIWNIFEYGGIFTW